jgi:hypothetical protein
MVATIKRDIPYFQATKKDVLGSGYGSLEQTTAQRAYGNRWKRVTLVYDFAVDGAIVANSVTAMPLRAEGESAAFVLPINAVIMRADYKVTTTFTSTTDAAVISIGIPTDDAAGIKAGIAISNGANPWDATNKPVATIQDGTTANESEMTTTATRSIVLTNSHATEATTAGALKLFIEYLEV